MICCNNTYNLGCFHHCSTISFGTADATEQLEVVFTFIGNYRTIIEKVTVQPIELDLTNLKEKGNYTIRFYKDGQKKSIEINGEIYDCFTLTTEL